MGAEVVGLRPAVQRRADAVAAIHALLRLSDERPLTQEETQRLREAERRVNRKFGA